MAPPQNQSIKSLPRCPTLFPLCVHAPTGTRSKLDSNRQEPRRERGLQLHFRSPQCAGGRREPNQLDGGQVQTCLERVRAVLWRGTPPVCQHPLPKIGSFVSTFTSAKECPVASATGSGASKAVFGILHSDDAAFFPNLNTPCSKRARKNSLHRG